MTNDVDANVLEAYPNVTKLDDAYAYVGKVEVMYEVEANVLEA